MELVGVELFEPDGSLRSNWWSVHFSDALADPYAYVISANIHRRHLTAEQKRELIAKLIKATPEKSNRQIAATVKAKSRHRRCNAHRDGGTWTD